MTGAVQAEKMRLMREAYTEVFSKLQSLKNVLLSLSEALYEEKELTSDRVKQIMQGSRPNGAK
jgi:ATP-dependent Zn protease